MRIDLMNNFKYFKYNVLDLELIEVKYEYLIILMN